MLCVKSSALMMVATLYTPLIWCFYSSAGRKSARSESSRRNEEEVYGVHHRIGAARVAGLSACAGVRQAGEHLRDGGVPEDGRRGGEGLRRLLGSPCAREPRL